jgi:hypothetical protein
MSDIEIEIDKMLRHLSGKDDFTRETLLRHAEGLPLAAVAGIREAVSRKRVGVGYVVNALKNSHVRASNQTERNQ